MEVRGVTVKKKRFHTISGTYRPFALVPNVLQNHGDLSLRLQSKETTFVTRLKFFTIKP